MSHTAKNILYCLLLCLAFTSCDKVPENGDLDGLWQLMEIQDNGTAISQKSNHLYCSFQLKLFMLGKGTNARAYFGRFEKNDGHIRFYCFTYRSDYSGNGQSEDKVMNDADDMKTIEPWGFYSTDCVYEIIKLNSSEMQLQHDNQILIYRKI